MKGATAMVFAFANAPCQHVRDSVECAFDVLAHFETIQWIVVYDALILETFASHDDAQELQYDVRMGGPAWRRFDVEHSFVAKIVHLRQKQRTRDPGKKPRSVRTGHGHLWLLRDGLWPSVGRDYTIVGRDHTVFAHYHKFTT